MHAQCNAKHLVTAVSVGLSVRKVVQAADTLHSRFGISRLLQYLEDFGHLGVLFSDGAFS